MSPNSMPFVLIKRGNIDTNTMQREDCREIGRKSYKEMN
jgi:hypothetical protein